MDDHYHPYNTVLRQQNDKNSEKPCLLKTHLNIRDRKRGMLSIVLRCFFLFIINLEKLRMILKLLYFKQIDEKSLPRTVS